MARTQSKRLNYIVETFDKNCTGYGNILNEKFSMRESIRKFCNECQGGHYYDWRGIDGKIMKKTFATKEVEECPSTTCYLYPFRMGVTSR